MFKDGDKKIGFTKVKKTVVTLMFLTSSPSCLIFYSRGHNDNLIYFDFDGSFGGHFLVESDPR